VGVDALALVEPVVQEQRVHVGLPGAVWRFTEVALLVHGFAELGVELVTQFFVVWVRVLAADALQSVDICL